MTEPALEAAAARATQFLRGLAERPVAARGGARRSWRPGWAGRCPAAPATRPRWSPS